DDAVTVMPGRAHFQCRRWRTAARAGDAHLIRPGDRHAHIAEIAHDVWKDISGWIADLVEHLLADRERHHQAAGARGLGDDERSVGAAHGDRHAHVVPSGNIAP